MDQVGKAKSGDGTLIAYRRTGGDGPPVIMVGGAFSTAAAEAPLAALLAPRFSVITYDRRGRGGSGDTAPYAVEREVEDIAALLTEAGGSASLYGMSSGAALALEAAATGLPITQLAVYEPPYDAGPAEITDNSAYTARLEELLAHGQREEAVELFLSMVGVPLDVVTGMRRSAMWQGMTALAHTLAYDNAVMGPGPVPTERLARITARVMVVDGGASPPPVRGAARAVAEALPRGRHRTLTGQVHEVAPHVLAPVLEEYFAAAA
ncbi:alpha/beta hydrolase [Streptomyces sp. NPDC006645]|uniref:alpha/beta fold hydrolase n=1 Tax=Streptomyces sp. NPDC006645 TaxID=3157184 RepID=UPI0033B5EDCD